MAFSTFIPGLFAVHPSDEVYVWLGVAFAVFLVGFVPLTVVIWLVWAGLEATKDDRAAWARHWADRRAQAEADRQARNAEEAARKSREAAERRARQLHEEELAGLKAREEAARKAAAAAEEAWRRAGLKGGGRP